MQIFFWCVKFNIVLVYSLLSGGDSAAPVDWEENSLEGVSSTIFIIDFTWWISCPRRC